MLSSAKEVRRRTLDDGEGSHREASHTSNGRWNRRKEKPRFRQRVQAAQVLDDRDAGAEEKRVGGPGSVGVVIDVERVDSNERRFLAHEKLDGAPGQEGVAFAV